MSKISVGLKRHKEDEIAYYLVGESDNSPSFDLPDLLGTGLLNIISFLPKSALQVAFPTRHHRIYLNANEPQPIRFSVLFTEKLHSAKDLPLDRVFLNVFLWTSTDKRAITTVNNIQHPHFFIPESKEVESALLDFGINKSKIISPGKALNEIVTRIQKKKIFPESTCKEAAQKRAKTIARFHDEVYPRETLPFHPLKVNEGQISQLLGAFGDKHWQASNVNDIAKRPRALSDSFSAVTSALLTLANFKGEKQAFSGKLPSCILAMPSISPALKDSLAINNKKLDPVKRRAWKDYTLGRQSEQNSRTYVNDKIQAKSSLEAIAFGIGRQANYCQFFDILGYLHGSFEVSPYLRTPIKGVSLSRNLHFFKPINFKKTNRPKVINRNIYKFGSLLSKSIPDEVALAARRAWDLRRWRVYENRRRRKV